MAGGNWWDEHPIVQPGQMPTGMNQPGQPMAPSFQGVNVSGYQNDADIESMGLDLAFNGGKGMASIINQSPAHEAARTYQKHIGQNNAELENTRRGVKPLIEQIEGLEATMAEAGPKVAGKAIGPNYAPSGDYNPAKFILPDTSSQSYQNLRAVMPWSGKEETDAAALNNRLHHFKKGIATLFKAIPGSGKSGATDQAQATLEEMVDAALHARNPEEFYKITHDAKNFLRSMGQQPVAEEPDKFTPKHWDGVPDEAVAELRKDTSKARRQQFDAIFGPGASSRILRSAK
jgi:hypothetical protein